MSQEKERETFKKALFQNFQDSGVLDFLKAQVRTSVVEKLRQKENTPSSKQKERSTEKKSTPKKIKEESYSQMAITLVLDFLDKHKFVYTNSVFLPEAKSIAIPLSRAELLDTIDPKKALFVSEDKPYLNSILEYLIAALKAQDEQPRSSKKGPVEKSLNFSEEGNVEDRFYKFKLEYEERMKEEIKQEIERIKKFELMNIRIEEGEKARQKMEEFRAEVEKTYNEKVQKLRDKEKEIIEKFKAQLKGLELANEDQKKNHYKDVESYKIMRDEMEGFMNKEKQVLMAERDRISKLERELNKKIAEVQAEKDAIVKQTEQIVKSAKHEAIKDIDRERSTIFKLKAQVENDLDKIGQIRDRAETAEFQNKRLLEANGHLTKELETARDRVRELERDVHHKKESADYFKGSFERDNEQLKRLEKQIDSFKGQVHEHDRAKEEIRSLLEHKRRELIDVNQRHIREIESYQQLIERVTKEKEALKRRINELEDEVKHLILDRSAHKHDHDGFKLEEGDSKDFMEASFGENDPRMKQAIQEVNASHRQSNIDIEIKQLKQRREQDVASLMMEPEFTKGVLKRKEPNEESPLKRSLVESMITGSAITGSVITGSAITGSSVPRNKVTFKPLNTKDKADLAAIRQYYSRGVPVDEAVGEDRIRNYSSEPRKYDGRGYRSEEREKNNIIKITESLDEGDGRNDLITRSRYSPGKDRRTQSNERNGRNGKKL